MSTHVERTLTYREFEELEFDDGLRRELIDGQIVVSPAAVRRHQRAVARLMVRLGAWGEERGIEVLPGAGVLSGEYSELVPDVVAALPNTAAAAHEKRYDIPPELVVEVSSPSTRRLDIGRKKELYAEAGVPEYWFIDLDAEVVLVHRLTGAVYAAPRTVRRGQLLESATLEGFSVEVDALLDSA
jgi:Uma2 family endonuclease